MTAKPPTAAQKRRWDKIVELGCIVSKDACAGRTTIHHCFTGGGGRKDHDKTIPLCWEHHLGAEGIDGKRMSKRSWQEKYGSEWLLLLKTNNLLDYDEKMGIAES